MVSAKSVAVFGSMLLGNVIADDKMGPAAFLWPPDREWSADADNTAPCGSTNGPGVRTEFPLVNGKLALVTQDITRSVHLSVSYESDPKSVSDFETFLGPSEVGSLDLGHTCVTVPSAPEGTVAGANATYRMLYVSNFEDESKRETFYACADVTFVDVFTNSIPCFNATVSDPDVDVDETVNVTTTDSGGKTPHTAADFTAENSENGSSGLSGGAIAGAAVGAIAGVSLLGLAAFFLWRRKNAKKNAVTEPMQQRWDAEKAVSETSSVNSRPQN
ncbi:GPI-anchored protein (WSC2) [Colletotrichum tofieldiae]|uniref:GPI-anchored protein (WSC2) n=1 Tax=Colletotrichum tofieldiae TaxID=708197 RepID=A0A166TXV6_9PEZI|nr:GPI-anchored protein (WSC2) [Colletotrichum tofieldiae]GKT95770.1 GPI-anchored protein [Colletotrichum tofieldiae]